MMNQGFLPKALLLVLMTFGVLRVSLAQQTNLSGFVKNSKGEPIVGASVILIQNSPVKAGITDFDGRFLLVGVESGRYKLSASFMGYETVEQNIVVRDQDLNIDITLLLASDRVTESVTLVEQSVLDAPATVHVITHNQIVERGYTNIQDVLDDIPEVEIQKKSMVEMRDNIGFRGIAGNEKFLILMDGVRISAATGDPHTVGQNYSVLNAERVEVVIGPASAVYGVDAFSGVVNIITRKGDRLKGTEIFASAGNFNTFENSLSIGGGKEDFSFSVSGSIYNTDEPNFPELYASDFSWYNDLYFPNGNVIAGNFTDTINISNAYPNRGFNFRTDAYSLQAKVTMKDFEIGYMNNGELHSSSTAAQPAFSLFNDDTRYGFSLEVIYGRHTFKSANEKLRIQSTVSLNSFETNPASLFRNVYTNYDAGYKYQFGKTKRISEQFDYRFSENFALVAGFAYEDIVSLPKTGDLPKAYDRNISPDLQNMYYLGTNQTDSLGNDLSIKQDFYFLQYQNIGGFAQALIKLGANLEATLGARYDYNTRYGTSFNPRLGLVYRPSSAIRLKLMYGESFLSPSPWKAFSHYGAFIPTFDNNGNATGFFSPFFHLPNPDLQPEKLRSFEFGSSYIVKNVIISLDVFYNELDNLINYFVPDFTRNSFQGVPVFFVETPQNTDASTTYGGTLGISANQTMGDFNLNYYAFYSYIDGDLNGEQLPYTAQSTVKAGVTFSGKRFSISPRVIYRGVSYSTVKDGDGNFIGNEAFTMLNVHANVRVIDAEKFKLNVFARINNALNATFYHVSNIGSEGFINVPQDPMRITAGVSAKF